ncbi:MAG: 1-acyl-sn-glycerol-3-phosphate acyltransferase [Bacteroidetes bacterium]|nr:1-acyl-sn-glycerol-3-phosphate acyltransferase [Bacteroidota bacterium]
MSLSLNSFYKRIKVKNKRVLEADAPMILALNHPNAFMDPVVFSLVVYPPKFKYLARGDAFKPGIAAYLLETLGLAPIYRIQDGGKEGLQKNSETYDRVNYFLRKRAKIIVFAEGLCIQERRLRPIKKGVPRMVFGAMDAIQNPDFVVVPVGINYSEASKVGSSMFYNIGEPIRVADFYEEYKEHPSKTYNKFIKVLEPRMKDLITHIENPENDKLVPWLEKIFMRDLCKQQKLKFKDPEHEFIITKKITEKVNTADQEQKETIVELNARCEKYFKHLNLMGVKDWVVNPSNKWQLSWMHVILRLLLIVAVLPIIIRGMLGNYLPYKISEFIVKKKVKHIEFNSSFNLGIGTFLTLFFYIIQFIIAYVIAPHIGWPLLIVLVSFLTGKFTLNFYPFILKTKGIMKALTNKIGLRNLSEERAQIVELFALINKN